MACCRDLIDIYTESKSRGVLNVTVAVPIVREKNRKARKKWLKAACEARM